MSDSTTVTIGDKEVEVSETDDGFEVTEVEEDLRPDDVHEDVWDKAKMYTSDESDIEVHRLGPCELVLVEDGGGDYWLQYNGEPLGDGDSVDMLGGSRISIS